MATKLTLPTPFHGMTHLWNVSANVGPDYDCPNLPADVQLVKYLASLNRQWSPGVVAGCKSPPMVVNTQFDAVLGFWITFWASVWTADQNINPRTIVPAKGAESSVIRLLNELAHQLAPAAWAKAPAHYNLMPEVRSMMQDVKPSALSGTAAALKKR